MADLGYGRGWLSEDAAASLWRVDAQIGHPLQITSAGRTRAEQQEAYDRYLAGTGSFAAYPGTSPHEFGNAIDTNERLVSILADHGWWRPLSFEPWHFVYRASADNHINEGTAAGGGSAAPESIQSQEDDMAYKIIVDGGQFLMISKFLLWLDPDGAAKLKGVPSIEMAGGTFAQLAAAVQRENGANLPIRVFVEGEESVYLMSGGELKPLKDPSTLAKLEGKGGGAIPMSRAEVDNLLNNG